MRTVVARVDRWLLADGSAAALAAFRVLVGAFATGYLLVRAPAFFAVADRPPGAFDPVGILAWLHDPLPAWSVRLVLVATIVAGVAFAAGVAFRASGPMFALGFLAVTTYRSSWGQLLWFESLPVLHVMIVGFAPGADRLALGGKRGETGRGVRYGWPLRLAAIVTVVTYVVAGVAKLRIGGAAWLDGDTLRRHVAYSAVRLEALGGEPSPFAAPFLAVPGIGATAGAAVIALELGAPLALLGRRARSIWVVGVWCMHVAIAATMFVVFPYPIALVAFLPLAGPDGIDALLRRVLPRAFASGAGGRA